MKRWTIAVSLVVTCLSSTAFADEVKKVTPRKQIAVRDFEDKSGGARWWQNAGTGMADMLTTALGKTDKFMVLERGKLEGVTSEQALASSAATAKGANAQMGKLVVAGLLVYGAITECGVQERTYAMVKRQTVKIAADVRLVDTTTGEVVKTFNADGNDTATGVNTAVGHFGASGYDETIMGKAVRECIDKIVDQISQASEAVPWSGKISQVSGDKVYVNSGANDGQAVGTEYDVYKIGNEITDPDSGASLGYETSKIGRVKIARVDQKFSVASVVNGTGFERGCLVKQLADSK